MSEASHGEPVLELEVVQLRVEADGVLSVVLADPQRRLLPTWDPGAHIDLWLSDAVRQYSLCGDPHNRREYRIAVLHTEDSRGGSRYIHESLRPGQVIDVGGPRNHFALVEAKEYIFIAGGIGITPILTMLSAAGDNWTLAYGGRTRASMAYRDDLEADPRVQLCPQDELGLLDLPAVLGEPRPDVAVYCCGPEPLLAAVEQACTDWPEGTLHVERFTAREFDTSEDVAFDILGQRSGTRVTVSPGESALDALAQVGISLPYACRDGVCGSCQTRVLEGIPEHRDAMTELDDVTTIMPCVSRAQTPQLVLDL